MGHALMATPNHDERAEQLFTRDLKAYIAAEMNPVAGRMAVAVEAARGPVTTFDDVEQVFDRLLDTEGFRNWIAMKRTAQEMMWESVAATVDRQLPQIEARAKVAEPKGSLRLDPKLVAPSYLARMDTHLMPGGYTVDEGEGAIRQGVIMDTGGAVYQLGRPMGPRNDGAGVCIPTHVAEVYPDLKPRRILDLGAGVGRAAVACADYFPNAEVYAIDVGASVLRYAHARAEALGAKVHFSQQNAEHTDFEDGFFDLVVSSAMFHETSEPSIGAIINEIHRLLSPGGATVNIEVPYRYWEVDLLGKLDAEWETHFNNESSYRAAVSADFQGHFSRAGFQEIHVGWQVVGKQPGDAGFLADNPKPVFALYVASARK
jgi:ubiquinone/menaquinone biosynthesis C-methylase UbiE